jgi:hypothetical protein
MKNDHKIYQRVTTGAALMGALLLAGCGGNSTIPAEKIAGAEKSIDLANKSNARSDAAVELKRAEDHLAEAKQAMENKDYDKASRLAESAAADADLAQAKASSAKSKKAAGQMRETVDSLKKELNQRQTR